MAKDENDNVPDTGDTSPTERRVAANESISPEELAELRNLTNSLLQAVSALQAQDGRAREFRGLVQDVRAATQALSLAPARELTMAHDDPIRSGECGCGPCECLSPSCCLFEVVLSQARATEMQLPTEPFDSNVMLLAQMEIRLFGSINGIGGLYPDLMSTFDLRKNIAKPGAWKPINVKIGTVPVCKGQSKKVRVDLEVLEVDEGGVEALGVRDEHGRGSVDLVLNCCLSEPFSDIIDVQLTEYGLGGGAIEVKVEARKICC